MDQLANAVTTFYGTNTHYLSNSKAVADNEGLGLWPAKAGAGGLPLGRRRPQRAVRDDGDRTAKAEPTSQSVRFNARVLT